MKRQISIAVVIAVVVSLLVPSFALADESEVQISGSVDTGLGGVVTESSSSETVKTDHYDLIEGKSWTMAYGAVGPLESETKILTPGTVYKHGTEDWVADAFEKNEYYSDGTFLEEQTVSAGPGTGYQDMHKEVTSRRSFEKSKELDFLSTGGSLAETYLVSNCGDVNTGVGMSGEYLELQSTTTLSTTDDGITNMPCAPCEGHCGAVYTVPEFIDCPCGTEGCPSSGDDTCTMCQCPNPEYDPNPLYLLLANQLCQTIGCCPGACTALSVLSEDYDYACEWMECEECEPVVGVQDTFSFSHRQDMTGEVSIGATVLRNDTQDIGLVHQQSYLGSDFTVEKTILVHDNESAEAPPSSPSCPIPPVP
jgi:hypothetical protein